jgi:hypothetical protein
MERKTISEKGHVPHFRQISANSEDTPIVGKIGRKKSDLLVRRIFSSFLWNLFDSFHFYGSVPEEYRK